MCGLSYWRRERLGRKVSQDERVRMIYRIFLDFWRLLMSWRNLFIFGKLLGYKDGVNGHRYKIQNPRRMQVYMHCYSLNCGGFCLWFMTQCNSLSTNFHSLILKFSMTSLAGFCDMSEAV